MGRERREFERIESLLSVEYTSSNGAISGSSLTKDVSEGGISIPSNGKIPLGTRLNCTIVLEDEGGTVVIAAAKVVWSRRNSEHWKALYSAGLRFLKIAARDRERLVNYAKTHKWVKSDFEHALQNNKVSILGGREDFLS